MRLTISLLCALSFGALVACQNSTDHSQAKALIATHCAACHQIPGVAQANGLVGPPLAGIARRQIIAGHFANTPSNLTLWVEHPQQMLPGDAMPEMGLTDDQARSIADYLYTLD